MTDETKTEVKPSEIRAAFEKRDALFIEHLIENDFKTDIKPEDRANLPQFTIKEANRVAKKMFSNEALQRACRKQGVDMVRVAKKLDELLECEHPLAEGKPDNAVQHKAVETVIRVLNGNPTPKLDITNTERREIVITAEAAERFEKYAQMRQLKKNESTGEYTE
ncbi:MAG: hypothetical protein WC455_17935 [Dehalococcoidia bacterium]|jgi:hypothetical protein